MSTLRLFRTALLSALCAGSALALTPSLTVQQVAQAAQEGDAMFHKNGAYVWGSYLLKTYTEDIRLRVDSPEVDGIALGTPYERLRYASFLASFQDMALTPAQSVQLAGTLKNKLTFLVYTHSPRGVGEEEEQWQQAYHSGDVKPSANREHSYLDAYKAATLTVGGRTLQAQPQIDGPYRDQFTLPTGGADFRFLGVVQYTFDLTGLPAKGTATLRFSDSEGNRFSQTARLDQLK
ncbi:hypothetical protein [Deinococcus sonorensis]|uniref:DUF3471 domain-containing protein n=2 Tax=Deinococcus sonorensis TaxID=309891 RepID=A0AAU7UEL5_9DEIO